ncbi:MAG: hypothetical protein R3C68_09885 [Myxococcota bacterium]
MPPPPPTCDPNLAGDCTYYYAEAESQVVTGPMPTLSSTAASGGAYLSSEEPEVGQVEFNVEVSSSAPHVVWARILAPSALADSFFVAANGAPEDVFDVAEGSWSRQWQWTQVNGRNGGAPLTLNPRVFSLEAGSNTLSFRSREVGAGIDVILVTDDLSFVPTSVSCVGETLVEENAKFVSRRRRTVPMGSIMTAMH